MLPEDVAARYQREGWWSDETIPQRSAAVCAEHGRRLAIIDGAIRLTFAEIAGHVETLAGWLSELTDEPGSVVSWQLPNWWEAAVVHHAALRAGLVPNPLNPAFRERELRFVLREARPSVLVVPSQWRGFDHLSLARALQAELGIKALVVVRAEPPPGVFSFEHLVAQPAASGVPPPARDPSAPALLLYTSGTTTDPKGVLHSHRTLLCEVDSFPKMHGLTPEDRYLGGAPVAHIAGLAYGLLAPFALGTSTVLIDRWGPARALEAIERERATFQTGPPTFLLTLADHPDTARADLSSFRLFSTGGANIPTARVREAGARLGCVIKRAYGSTEVPTLTATTLDDDEEARVETDGRAIGGAEVRIVGGDGTDVAPGEEGEIYARAPEMFTGYRNEAMNEDAFDEGGWFRTGDVGSLDARGLLRVTGRLKDIIIRSGENISAEELEELLSEHPAIADVAIVGIPDERLGELVCAVVAVRDGASLGLEDVVSFLIGRGIAKHKFPERLEVRATLPKTESGKIQKTTLRAELG